MPVVTDTKNCLFSQSSAIKDASLKSVDCPATDSELATVDNDNWLAFLEFIISNEDKHFG